jgi:hypothetical protein
MRRGIARGSLVGVGLIALTTSGLPVALAGDEEPDLGTSGLEADLDGVEQPAPEVLVLDDEMVGARVVDPKVVDEVVPDDVVGRAATIEGFFGSGKTVNFQVEYDDTTAPTGLDLSGAEFTLTGDAGTFSCTTDVTGQCAVTGQWSPGLPQFVVAMFGIPPQASSSVHAVVPRGTYAVTQTASPVGLAAAAGTAEVHLCNDEESCGDAEDFAPVVNDSVFRSPVVSAVRDAIIGAPIEGAVYTLTGPGYVPAQAHDVADEGSDEGSEGDNIGPDTRPLTDAPGDTHAAAAERVAVDELLPTVEAASAADGSLTFPGWFLPGTDYVLSPVGVVDGYEADSETTTIEIEAPTTARSASFDARLLTPIGMAGPGDSTPTPGPTPVAAPAPAAVAAPAGGGAPAGRARVPAAAARTAEPSPAGPSTPSAPSATGTFDRSGAAKPTAAPLAGRAVTPELTTVSSNLPDKGLLMALGVLFLIIVVVAAGLVRRHARRRA